MKKATWKDIAELVGMATIIVSLVFVVVELRQAQRIAVAAQYQERAALVIDIYNTQIESETALSVLGPPVVEAMRSGRFPEDARVRFADHTAEQLAFEIVSSSIALTTYDNLHFQYQSGFISDESWRAFRVRLRQNLEWPITRAVFTEDKDIYRASFRELCEGLIAESEAARNATTDPDR